MFHLCAVSFRAILGSWCRQVAADSRGTWMLHTPIADWGVRTDRGDSASPCCSRLAKGQRHLHTKHTKHTTATAQEVGKKGQGVTRSS